MQMKINEKENKKEFDKEFDLINDLFEALHDPNEINERENEPIFDDYGKEIEIISRDYWVKIVEFLQQNWALIDPFESGVKVFFFHDLSGVFDEMIFPSIKEAEKGLLRNGFSRFSDNKEFSKFLAIPKPPFYRTKHPNGLIYSSGRFWIS